MTLHLSTLAHAAGVAAFCLTPTFADAMEPAPRHDAPLPTLENSTPKVAKPFCASWASILEAREDFKPITLLESTLRGTDLPSAYYILVEPEAKNWILIKDSPVMGPCLVEEGTQMTFISQDEVDAISLGSALMQTENMGCESMAVAKLDILDQKNQPISLHGVTEQGEDFFLTHNNGEEWNIAVYKGISNIACQFSSSSGTRSYLSEEMLDQVYGRHEKIVLTQCKHESIPPIHMPWLSGSYREDEGFHSVVNKHPLNKPDIAYCYDGLS